MRSLLRSLGAGILSLLLVLGAVEGIARLLGARPEEVEPVRFSWLERGELWRLEPGRSRTLRRGHPVSINRHGFRDREFLPPEPGSARILFLGDSVTYGHDVRIEDAFVRRLESELAERGVRARVLNAGIPGWSTHQQWLFYRDHAEALAVDVVLVGFVLNDATEIQRGLLEIGLAEGLALARAVGWLTQRSAAAASLKRLYARIARPEEREVPGVRQLVFQPDAPAAARAMEQVERTLGRLAALALERDDAFGLVLFPFPFQISGADRDAPQRRLARFAREHGFPVLDTLPLLRERGGRRAFIDVSHLSPRGHALVAEAIAEWLAGTGLLEASPFEASPLPPGGSAAGAEAPQGAAGGRARAGEMPSSR